MDLDFSGLRGPNVSRCNRWFGGGVDTWSDTLWLTAIAGEIGQAQNILKKISRARLGLIGNEPGDLEPVLSAELGAEIADAVIYLDLFAEKKGVDLNEALSLEADDLEARLGRAGDMTAAMCLFEAGATVNSAGSGLVDCQGAQVITWVQFFGFVLGALIKAAECARIPLRAEVPVKFNRTSVKHGFPECLPDRLPDREVVA